MSTPLIRVRDLCKVYDLGDVQVEALKNVSLEIDAGEMLAIMGTSGSGKSTLMNILGCLDRPTSGTYSLAGIDVSTMSSDERATIRNRRIGFVFQNFNLLARTSAIENVELPLFYSDVPLEEQHRRAEEALAAVGLGNRLHSLPNQLSGGQQQRVAVARALVNRPSLLLADEPTGNLDSATSEEIMTLFADLHRREHLTIILVTHEAEIARYAERVITFLDGRIVSDEPQPALRRAAGT
jgi:putative ABC transport system ATP-binding protein